MSVQRIGIVGCKKHDSRTLQRSLVRHGYLADAMDAGADIVAYCQGVKPLVLVLDVGGDQEIIVKAIESIGTCEQKPLVVVAGPTSDPDFQVRCLAMGADDFVPQPIQPAELLERLGILLGRDAPGFSADSAISRVEKALTTTERGIFVALQEVMPKTLTREEIMWNIRKQRITPDDRSLDVYISHIRKKLELIRAGFAIETVRGKGFRLVEQADTSLGPDTGTRRGSARNLA